MEQYGFMHLGFQEYLAAREIRSRAFTDPAVLRELARHYGESWWQEVTLLMLALEDPSLFVPLMREVVRQPAFADSPSMVEMCLDDAAEAKPAAGWATGRTSGGTHSLRPIPTACFQGSRVNISTQILPTSFTKGGMGDFVPRQDGVASI